MSYSTSTLEIATHVSCDKPNCINAATILHFEQDDPKVGPLLDTINRSQRWQVESTNKDMALAQFKGLGWTFWSGARTNYTYCNEHKPSATSRSTTDAFHGKRISASCYHDKHGERCDQVMRVSQYRRYRACKCGCHQGEE